MTEQDTCLATGKNKFATKGLTNAALRAYEGSKGWDDKLTRRYWCKLCNGRHLTSHEPYRGKAPRSERNRSRSSALLVNPAPGSAR